MRAVAAETRWHCGDDESEVNEPSEAAEKDDDETEYESDESESTEDDELSADFREFLSKSKLKPLTVRQYISSYKNFLLFANQKDICQKSDLEGLMSADEQYFEKYLKSLDTLGARKCARHMCHKLLSFIGFSFINEPPDAAHYLNLYFVDQSRKEDLIGNFDSKNFDGQRDLQARKFVMTEVLLSTRSIKFIKNLTMDDFYKSTADGEGKWNYTGSYNDGKVPCTVNLPDQVHVLVKKYVSHIRPKLLSEEKQQQNNLFSIGITNLNRVEYIDGLDWIESISKSDMKLSIDKILSIDFCYKCELLEAHNDCKVMPFSLTDIKIIKKAFELASMPVIDDWHYEKAFENEAFANLVQKHIYHGRDRDSFFEEIKNMVYHYKCSSADGK